MAPLLIGGERSLGPVGWGDIETVDEALKLPAPEVERVGDDVLLRYVISH